MPMPYKLTEEIARYRLEVALKGDAEWEICFSNPTAGPWKLITIGGYVGGKELRYMKEEDRPDLILFNKSASLFLILEAKDSVNKFVTNGKGTKALGKAVQVFDKESRRLDDILKNAAKSIWGPDATPEWLLRVGYLLAAPADKPDDQHAIGTLVSYHRELTKTLAPRLRTCVIVRVRQYGNHMLRLELLLPSDEPLGNDDWRRVVPNEVSVTRLVN